jgi:hypothetical protein
MKRKILYIAALFALFTGGCKKTFLDVNKDPNNLTGTISPSFVFTNALAQTATNLVDMNEIGSYYAGHWTQSSSYIYSTTTFAYQFNNTNFNFYDPMFNNLMDYQYVIDNAVGQKQPFLKGPALVMKAMVYQELVDLYGNVPFTEALKAAAKLAPKFDDQKAVYEALIPMLDTAISNLKANPFTGVFSSSDVTSAGTLGGGNTTKWIKFANSLKMRILIRQSRITGRDTYIVPEIQKILAEGSGFLDAGQDMGVNPGFIASTGKQNPMYEKWGYAANGATQALARYPRITKYLMDQLIMNDDTFRLKRIAYPVGGENKNAPGTSVKTNIVANYKGVPFGAPSGYTAGTVSPMGPAVLVYGKFNNPIYLMLAAESQLLLAEAAQRYTTITFPKTAQQYYEQGVRESFRVNGAADAQATTVLTSGKDMWDWTASPDKFKAIWMQKWLAFANFEGLEAWSEVRRTNWPPIPISAGVAAGVTPPVRLFYPSTELGSNGVNVLAQGTINVFTSRLFWDVD